MTSSPTCAGWPAGQLDRVMQPRLLALRRLVIGESGRFPELGQLFYERGPGRTMSALSTAFGRLAQRGLVELDDPDTAAAQFNWLVMSTPLNAAMLLGDDAAPTAPNSTVTPKPGSGCSWPRMGASGGADRASVHPGAGRRAPRSTCSSFRKPPYCSNMAAFHGPVVGA